MTQGFETSQYAQGFFITGARTAPNKEAAELVCREVMSYIELHATTQTSATIKELSGCVEMHKSTENEYDATLPWHFHIVIYLTERKCKSQNFWTHFIMPVARHFQQKEIRCNVDWLRMRTQAYKYITKEGAHAVVLDKTHPFYFNPEQYKEVVKSGYRKQKDYRAANIAKTKQTIELGFRGSMEAGLYPLTAAKQV